MESMAQLLDRYRRLSDGKAFVIVSLGCPTMSAPMLTTSDRVSLEAEDGELIESQTSAVRGFGRFERMDD